MKVYAVRLKWLEGEGAEEPEEKSGTYAVVADTGEEAMKAAKEAFREAMPEVLNAYVDSVLPGMKIDLISD